jgi:hypothetical protein
MCREQDPSEPPLPYRTKPSPEKAAAEVKQYVLAAEAKLALMHSALKPVLTLQDAQYLGQQSQEVKLLLAYLDRSLLALL